MEKIDINSLIIGGVGAAITATSAIVAVKNDHPIAGTLGMLAGAGMSFRPLQDGRGVVPLTAQMPC